MPRPPLTLLVYVEHFHLAGGGSENAVVGLLRALAGRGHRVHVVARYHAPCAGVQTHDWSADSPALRARLQPDLTLDWGLCHEADLHRLGGGTHAAYQRLNAAAYPPPLRALKRLALLPWVQDLTLPFNRDARTIRREHPLLTNPTAWYVANSQATAAMAISAGATPARVRVIHNGVDTVRFSPAARLAARAAARVRFGLPEDAIVGLFAAHNLRLKNLALLRLVSPAIHRRFPAWRLLVVGKKAPRWSAPWLVYGGHVEDMTTAYAAADLLLHPTYFDSFANVILEAMSCGLPVMVSDHSGACELLTSGDNGVVLPVHGPRGVIELTWTDALLTLLADPAAAPRYGHAARATAETQAFVPYVDRIEALLGEVAAARQGA